MYRRIGQFLVIVAMGLMASAVPASAQGYPPTAGGMGVTPSAGPVGTTTTITGTCTPGAVLTVLVGQRAVGSVTAGPTGAFLAVVTIPNGVTPGQSTLSVSGSCPQATAFTVQGTHPAAFAFTGARIVYGLSELAAALTLLGAVAVFATRRRRDESVRPADA